MSERILPVAGHFVDENVCMLPAKTYDIRLGEAGIVSGLVVPCLEGKPGLKDSLLLRD